MFCVNVTILLIGCHCFVMVDISRVLFLLEYVLQGSLEILINVAFRHITVIGYECRVIIICLGGSQKWSFIQ